MRPTTTEDRRTERTTAVSSERNSRIPCRAREPTPQGGQSHSPGLWPTPTEAEWLKINTRCLPSSAPLDIELKLIKLTVHQLSGAYLVNALILR